MAATPQTAYPLDMPEKRVNRVGEAKAPQELPEQRPPQMLCMLRTPWRRMCRKFLSTEYAGQPMALWEEASAQEVAEFRAHDRAVAEEIGQACIEVVLNHDQQAVVTFTVSEGLVGGIGKLSHNLQGLKETISLDYLSLSVTSWPRSKDGTGFGNSVLERPACRSLKTGSAWQ